MSKQTTNPFSTRSHHSIVERLKNMIRDNNWTNDFEVAIKDARKTGVEEMTEIKNLDDFYNFLDDLVTWVPTEDQTGTYVYRRLCTMYFVLDQETVKPLQTSIVPSYPPLPFTKLTEWMIDFAKSMGEFLSTPASINEESLQTFYTAQNYNIDSYEVPQGGWTTFNEFFARKFLPGTRPIDGPSNPAVIVSAADSTFDGFWDIDDKSIVTLKSVPWSIKELLDNSKYADDFAGGQFMHAFLAPYDYHRLHAPVEGKVLEAKVIDGQTYLEVVVQKDPDDPDGNKLVLMPGRKMKAGKVKEVSAPDSPGYQFCQARGLIVIESTNPDIGKVAVLPVGMSQVSSVVILDNIKPGAKVKKGDELSYFQFGGSDIVLVFQKRNISITATEHRHYRMGEQIAVAHKLS